MRRGVASVLPCALAIVGLSWTGTASAATSPQEQIPVRELVARDVPARGIRAFSYRSAIMGRVYDITLRFPRQYQESPDQRFPALIVTDGNRMFAAANHALSAVEAEIEQPMLIVAIGTPFEEGELAFNRRRVHEFSAPGWAMEDAFGKTVAQSCAAWGVKPAECVGGAPKFLKFIAEELLPDLAKGHRIDRDKLTLGGVSAGGYFAAWAMFQDASPFSSYIISSPAMAYGDGEVFRAEARYAANHDDLPAGVYISSGSLEMDHPFLEGVGKIVSGHAHLSGVLRTRAYPGLRLHSEIHPGLGHVDAAPAAYARGLRLLFPKTQAAGARHE